MYIHSLTLNNVKSFESLKLSFDRANEQSSGKYAGLNFFVGGNSSGKSTLLKSLAMALSGPVVANQQLISAAGWIREGQKRATIELKVVRDPAYDFFNAGKPPNNDLLDVGLLIEAESVDATPVIRERIYYKQDKKTAKKDAQRGPWDVDRRGWSVAAYGPMRRLTGSSTEAVRYALARGNLASCLTLFREDAALSESELWLKHQHSRYIERERNSGVLPSELSLAEQVRMFLNSGLMPNGFEITRVSVDDVFMNTPNGGELPLRDLSDGFRSTYALMLDIIHNMASTYGEKNLFSFDERDTLIVNKPGVILIDEVEAHLHPSWQRVVCEWLRTRFPLVQFFITTHSPLVVQTADKNGIYVLPLPGELSRGQEARQLEEHEWQRIVMGRAEKVLLGEAFGLTDTWGPRAQELISQWRKLAAAEQQGIPLSDVQKDDLSRLRSEMQLILADNEEPIIA